MFRLFRRPGTTNEVGVRGHAVHVNPLNGSQQRIARNAQRAARIKTALSSLEQRLVHARDRAVLEALKARTRELEKELRIREALSANEEN